MGNVIEQATAFCEENKERLTRPRLEVLKILFASNRPLGAYEILKNLSTILRSPKPPTVYRAIEFWEQNGFIHRIESLSAYTVCHAGHRHKESQFMICSGCGLAIEASSAELGNLLKQAGSEKSFLPSSWKIEIYGLCQSCR